MVYQVRQQRLKVAFCFYGSNQVSGPGSWLIRMLPQLRANGISPIAVRYATVSEPSLIVTKLQSSGIKVIELPGKGKALNEGVALLLQAWAKEQPDIIVADHVLQALLGGYWTRAAGIPMVMVMRSDDSWYWKLVDEFVAGNKDCQVDGLITVSRELESRLRKSVSEHCQLLYCPSSVPIPEEHQLASWQSDEFHVVYLGRLDDEQKRIVDLTKALITVSQQRPSFRATIYGDGGERKAIVSLLEQTGQHRVHYGGFLEQEQVYPALQSAQALVLFSRYEGLSTAVQEAMACGLPVICKSMSSGIKDIIVHQETGWILADDEELGIAIDTLAASSELWTHLSKNAYQKARQELALSGATQHWLEFLFSLANAATKDTFISPDSNEIEPILAMHQKDKAELDEFEAWLLVRYVKHWCANLQRFVMDRNHDVNARRRVLRHALERRIISRESIDVVATDLSVETSLRHWFFALAISQGMIDTKNTIDFLKNQSVDAELRRWLLYRVQEADAVPVESLRVIASSLVNQLADNNNEKVIFRYQLASLLMMAERWVEAQTIFMTLLSDPDASEFYAGSHFYLGQIDVKKQHLEGAAIHFRACLKYSPEHKKAAMALQSISQRVSSNQN